MKANRFAGLARRDEGVSTVLGAVLVFALFIITLVTIQTQFVPVWQKQRESGLMDNVAQQFGALKAGLDQQVGNVTLVPVSTAMPLKADEGFAFFSQASLPGTVTFSPAATGQGIAVSSSQLTIQQQNGFDLWGLSETWTTATGSIAGITDIEHLRLRVVDPENQAGGDMSFTLTDANGKCAGKLQIAIFTSGSDRTIEDRVFGPQSPLAATCSATPITIRDTDAKKQTSPAYYYLDAFDRDLQFTAVLAAATYPVTAALVQNTLSGDYTMVYDSLTGGQHVGGTGLVVPNYAKTTAAGTLKVTKTNQQFPEQTYTLEYGALILDQPDGSAMVVAPQFQATATAVQTAIGWSVPALVGSPNAITGSSSATITSTPGARTFLTALAPRLTFTINTVHPALWSSFWDAQLVAAGLTGNVAAAGAACTGATVQYSICTTASTATLNVFGPTAAPASTANDLFLNFQSADLGVTLLATG